MNAVWNRTDKVVSEMVEAHELVIKPFSSLLTTPRKAAELIRRRPEELTLIAPTEQYSDGDRAGVMLMTIEQLRDFALKLMAGLRPTVAAAMPSVAEKGMSPKPVSGTMEPPPAAVMTRTAVRT